MGLENQYRISGWVDKQEGNGYVACDARAGFTNIADVSIRYNSVGGRVGYNGTTSASVLAVTGLFGYGASQSCLENKF
jgi:hypothetical protein